MCIKEPHHHKPVMLSWGGIEKSLALCAARMCAWWNRCEELRIAEINYGNL